MLLFRPTFFSFFYTKGSTVSAIKAITTMDHGLIYHSTGASEFDFTGEEDINEGMTMVCFTKLRTRSIVAACISIPGSAFANLIRSEIDNNCSVSSNKEGLNCCKRNWVRISSD